MPQAHHPRYVNIRPHDPDTLIVLIQNTLSMADYLQLPAQLGMNNVWFSRKLSSPNTFTVQEARTLAAALNMPVSDLALHYAVGLDEMTAGDILNILLEDGHMHPYAAAAAPALPVMDGNGAGTVVATEETAQP